MVLLPTGSDELVFIQTDKVSVTVKGKASHPDFQGVECAGENGALKVFCEGPYALALRGIPHGGAVPSGGYGHSGSYAVPPMFYEQQHYELIIEALGDHRVAFWHDSLALRSEVTKAGRSDRLLSGVISFGNEIGLSDLVIRVDGAEHLRLTVEVFPTRIDYKEDYKALLEDVTREVYNLVFDFLKKTYLGYRQGDRMGSSPVEFFAVIRRIYSDLLRAADRILAQPHHLLKSTCEVAPAYRAKRVDNRGLRWLEKHPEKAKRVNGQVAVTGALAVKKQITYDTKENRLTGHILRTAVKRLEDFRRSFRNLRQQEDRAVEAQLDDMIRGLIRRCGAPVLADVGTGFADTGMSLVFSMAPGYRELYKHYLMLQRGLAVTGDVFRISVKDLGLLYEYWCFIKLNSLMKERYELVSQDVIRVRGNGLCVALVKGRGSRVKYRNPVNGETVLLSYSPRIGENPTGIQQPDNVLQLTKRDAGTEYTYVFDARYRINPALPGTEYHSTVAPHPGPEVSDINTMHRYRDAIVYQSGASPFERILFGAYVLFPYGNEAQYRSHRFFRSIGKVNIGGLPFLPSATGLVTQLLDELIADSPDSAFERATLPRGIEKKLATMDWSRRDVLVGSLRDRNQLAVCLTHNFYHVPAGAISESDLPIRYVAIYQSVRKFGAESGIRYYGEVTKCIPVARHEIREIPRLSREPYYRLEIREWKQLPRPIAAKEVPITRPVFTNLFLLEHSTEIPELYLKSVQEYRFYMELKRALRQTEIRGEGAETGFRFQDALVVFENGRINLYQDRKITASYTQEAFTKTPGAVFRNLRNLL